VPIQTSLKKLEDLVMQQAKPAMLGARVENAYMTRQRIFKEYPTTVPVVLNHIFSFLI
jgi:hypothetical protein